MFKAIRKLIRRLLIVAAILIAVAVVGILWATPKLLTNVGGCVLLVGFLWVGLLGICESLDRGGSVGPSDEELRRRYNRHGF